jgi:hypothetical protein
MDYKRSLSLDDLPDIRFDVQNYKSDIPKEREAAVVAILGPLRAAGENPIDVLLELAFRDGANQAHRQECKTENCPQCAEALGIRAALTVLRTYSRNAIDSMLGPDLDGLTSGVNAGKLTQKEAEHAALEQHEKTGNRQQISRKSR